MAMEVVKNVAKNSINYHDKGSIVIGFRMA